MSYRHLLPYFAQKKSVRDGVRDCALSLGPTERPSPLPGSDAPPFGCLGLRPTAPPPPPLPLGPRTLAVVVTAVVAVAVERRSDGSDTRVCSSTGSATPTRVRVRVRSVRPAAALPLGSPQPGLRASTAAETATTALTTTTETTTAAAERNPHTRHPRRVPTTRSRNSPPRVERRVEFQQRTVKEHIK